MVATAAVAVAPALVATGCTGGSGGSIESPAQPRGGKTIFSEYCGGCHTLAAAGGGGSAGPNLDQSRLTTEQINTQVERGGGGMPAFAAKLSAEEIRVVAEYVAANRRR